MRDPALIHSLTLSKLWLAPTQCQYRLVFSVGAKPMENFRMIERHYHGEKLIRSYDFDFGFCVPLSKNSWEALYPLPTLDEDQIQDMVRKTTLMHLK